MSYEQRGRLPCGWFFIVVGWRFKGFRRRYKHDQLSPVANLNNACRHERSANEVRTRWFMCRKYWQAVGVPSTIAGQLSSWGTLLTQTEGCGWRCWQVNCVQMSWRRDPTPCSASLSISSQLICHIAAPESDMIQLHMCLGTLRFYEPQQDGDSPLSQKSLLPCNV